MSAITMPVMMVDSEGVETTVNLPAKWEICPQCQGHGKSSAYLGAFTRDEMDEQGQEFMEDYMRGDYDRACEHCKGSGKVLVEDEQRCETDEQRRALAWLREQYIADAEERATLRAEMRLTGDC